MPQTLLDVIVESNTEKEVEPMKNIIYIIFACVFIIACGDESINIITDDEKSVSYDWNQNGSESNVVIERNLEPVVNNKAAADLVDEKNLVGTPLIDEPEPEPIVEIIPEPNEPEVAVEPDPIRINDDEKPPMVIADIRGKLIKADKYEVSIEAFCKVFPHMRETLIKRIIKSLQRGAFKFPEPDINKYPAIVTYSKAVEYAESIGRRLPTTQEWKGLANGNGIHGKSNHGRGWICLAAEQRVKHVDRKGAVANGFGVYEMMGNVEEWCDGRRVAGISYKRCDANVRNWFPIKVPTFDDDVSGFRCVDDIE